MKPGQVNRFKLDSLDGARFTLDRIEKMVCDAKKDPLVIATARKIAGLSTSGRKVASTHARKLLTLRGIHAWCRGNFEYVDDPAGIELIQTPNRMLRLLQIPRQLHEAMWKPIAKELGGKLPDPKIEGDSDEASTLALSLAAAVGFENLVLRLGGTESVIHYAWAGVQLSDGKLYDIDILHPKFNAHHTTWLENMPIALWR